MSELKIYHKDWNDIIKTDNNFLFRTSGSKDIGEFIAEDEDDQRRVR